LVIAYPDEETLRELIAAPSIVTLGYTSRADAVKNMYGVTTKASLKRLLKTASLHPNMTFFDGMQCGIAATRRWLWTFGHFTNMRNCLRNGLAVSTSQDSVFAELREPFPRSVRQQPTRKPAKLLTRGDYQ
jgi:hypothetical protein